MSLKKSGAVKAYYTGLFEKYESYSVEIPAERQIAIKVKVKSLWDDMEAFKSYFLETE